MDETIQLFLAVLASALKGKRPATQDISAAQWRSLFHLATIHNVLPLFYEALYDQPSLAADPALLSTMRQNARWQVSTQIVRTVEFLELNDRLTAAGIKPLVVKGIVCRSLYPQPDHRPSSDEDVWTSPEAIATCHSVLTAFGMAPQGDTTAYEVSYRKDTSPIYIELHKSLFPPENEAYGDLNRFFDDAQARAVAMNIQGHTVYTMSPTDHLFYLICHAFKHFLHSGFGIRQVCDIALYAAQYDQDVDWTRILAHCQAIRAEKFAAAVFAIGQRHLDIPMPKIWQSISVDERPMLWDLLGGGLYGDANMSRKHSSNITLEAIAAQKAGKKARHGLWASVFPSATKLEGRYPYLKKHPYLLPVAWCSRLLQYGQEIRTSQNNRATDALKIGAERVALLKLYEIIE